MKSSQKIKKGKDMLKQLLRKLLFDNTCSLCGCHLENKGYLCSKCIIKLEKMSDLKQRENLYYLYYYTDVKKIIYDLKFKNRKGVTNSLRRYVKESIEQIQIKEEIDVVISVPVNKKRFLERGYNQVDEILKSADIKFENIERVKNTKHMYEIKEYKKRKENVKKAFKVTKDYFQKNILVVDDIVTTGATIKEIEKEFLENQKAKNVIFFTIAVVRDYFK